MSTTTNNPTIDTSTTNNPTTTPDPGPDKELGRSNTDTPVNECCPPTTGGGGEVHHGWDGWNTQRQNLIRWYMVWDDNYCDKPPISQDTPIIFDHYAVEWAEVHADGSLHGILSKRQQVCLWPETTIASEFITIGTPIGASLNSNCEPLKARKCGNCLVDTTWCRYRITINRNMLSELIAYGGLEWDNVEYIAGAKNLISPTAGITGPLGKNASISGNRFRITNPNIPSASDLSIFYNSGQLTTGRNNQIFNDIIYMADSIGVWRNQGLLNLEFGGPTVEYRRNIWPNTESQGSNDPCCGGTDLDYLYDNECGGMCCSDGIEVKYILPTSSLLCYIKQNGNLVKSNVSQASLSFIPSNYIPANNPISINALTQILLPTQTTDEFNNQVINNIPIENYPTTACNETIKCIDISYITPINSFETITGYAVDTTFSVSGNTIQHTLKIKDPALPNFIQEINIPVEQLVPVVVNLVNSGCLSLLKSPCVSKGFRWNTSARSCASSTCCS